MKAFRITSANQFVQQVKLEPGEHTFSGYIYAESYSSSHRVQLRGSAGNFDIAIPLNVNWAWQYFSVTFTIYDTMTALDLSNSSYPVRILAPMFETGNNASTHRPNDLDLEEELENVDTKYGEKVIELDGKITQTKEQFEIDYTKKTEMESYVDGVKEIIQTDYNSKFIQTAEQIALKASKEEVNGLGSRVTEAEQSIDALTGEISSKVSRTEFDEFGDEVSSEFSEVRQTASEHSTRIGNSEDKISEVEQTADNIRLSVDDLSDGLEATGIDIALEKITIRAPKLFIEQPNGNPVAVFNENFLLDDFGNMRIKSLRTPFALRTQWSGINFEDTPNVILTSC